MRSSHRTSFILDTQHWFRPACLALETLPKTSSNFAEDAIYAFTAAFNEVVEYNRVNLIDDRRDASEMLTMTMFANLSQGAIRVTYPGDDTEDEETPFELDAYLTEGDMEQLVEIATQLFNELTLTHRLDNILADTKLDYLGRVGYDLRFAFTGQHRLGPAPVTQLRLVRQQRHEYDGDDHLQRSWL